MLIDLPNSRITRIEEEPTLPDIPIYWFNDIDKNSNTHTHTHTHTHTEKVHQFHLSLLLYPPMPRWFSWIRCKDWISYSFHTQFPLWYIITNHIVRQEIEDFIREKKSFQQLVSYYVVVINLAINAIKYSIIEQ